jgi:pilus assembly protein CpaF
MQRAGATRLGPPDAEEPPSGPPEPAPAADEAQPPPLPDATEASEPPTTDRLRAALAAVMRRLSDSIDVRQPRERELGNEERTALRASIDRLLSDGAIGPEIDRRFVADAAEQEAVGLGPLGPLLATGRLREVVVQGATSIHADMGGGLTPVAGFFSSTEALMTTARRLLARAGRELGSQPAQRVRLPGGIQLDVLTPPLVRNAPVMSLRCPAASLESSDFLLTDGWLSDAILDLLRRSMQAHVNVLVSGTSGAGVSTLLSGLALSCAPNARFVTIERTPSLRLGKLGPVALDRVGQTQGKLAPLLTHAQLLRPDHLVLDDIDGEDALPLLREASCRRGVLAGMHAPSVGDALEWLDAHASLALGTREALAPLLARSFQLAVHVGRDDDGAHRIMDVAEIRGAREGALDAALLYRYEGGFRATGTRPGFLPS